MNRKKILIISLTDQNSDPRVVRQINCLKDNYDIYCCGVSNNIIPENNFYPVIVKPNTLFRKIVIGSLKMFRSYTAAENYILDKKIEINFNNKNIRFDLIIANDMDTIPIAFRLFSSEKVLADFHEYAPEEFEDKLYWKLIHKNYIYFQCRKYFPLLNGSTTVCKSIADEYNKNFGIIPEVITNAAEYIDLKPIPLNENMKIIHHGAAISSRKIEIMIQTAKLLDKRFTFDLMLIPNETAYYNSLKEMIRDNENIKIIEPVSFNEIIPFCNSYDIGLFILPHVNLNYRYALPNKFFEFVQSRLAIVTGPSVEMADYISEYKLGISTRSFNPEEIADEINGLTTEQIRLFKENSHKHAKELSSEKNMIILNNLVSKLLTQQ
ncbi:MAG: hypothetical protein ABI792_00910 [bacterium]